MGVAVRAAAGWTELDPADPAWSLIEAAWASRAALAVAPLQDVLRLGAEARMNLPGTEAGQLAVALQRRRLTGELAAGLRALTERNGRGDAGGGSRTPTPEGRRF